MTESALTPFATPGSLTLTKTASHLERYGRLIDQVEAREPINPRVSHLVDGAVDVLARPGFDRFISLSRLRFQPFGYQLQTAQTVLRRLHGRAILADDVGLGKTIEAGLVLSELRMRGLASNTLILCPDGLVDQWLEELHRKFALPSRLVEHQDHLPRGTDLERPVAVASISSACRLPLRDDLVAVKWDLVIVDEAHHLKDPASSSAHLVGELAARHLLLLTAMPADGCLSDLFTLSNLVSPGVLGTAREFRARHGGDTATVAKQAAFLRARMGDVMVRHRRHEVKPTLPGRSVETVTVTATSSEADLYGQIAQRVRREGRGASPARAALLQRVLQMACSSPAAVRSGLEKLGWDDLDAAARELDSCAKASALLSVVRRHVEVGEKVLVFTGFRRTQQFLADILHAAGIETVVYHDRLARRRKDMAVAAFAGPAPVLLTTEAAGEGRSLQFCHVMVNFDLPWDLLQLENRLGRIHRVGQVRDVTVINLVTRATIERPILGVIEAKLKLFDLVVGELNMILGRMDDYCFDQLVFEAYAASSDGSDFAVRLEKLGDQLAEARDDYLTGRQCSDALIGESWERPCAS